MVSIKLLSSIVLGDTKFHVKTEIIKAALTEVSRRLQAVFCQSTPADGEDVSGVEGAPIVKGASPAVKHDENLLTPDLSHCGGTNQVGVLPVHRF